MIKYLKQYRIFLITMAIISAVILSLFYNALKPPKTLPIYNPAMVNPELVDSTMQHVAIDHRIADFKFTNQNGKIITQKEYEGKVYVADFFFTTCPTICPIMTKNMADVQNALKDNDQVMLLSHTVMPDVDTVPVLKKYAVENGVNDQKWNLVTGAKEDIYSIARKSYLAVKLGAPEELYDMVHTENFVLVDQKRRVRGFYDGTNADDMKRLIEDVKFLTDTQH